MTHGRGRVGAGCLDEPAPVFGHGAAEQDLGFVRDPLAAATAVSLRSPEGARVQSMAGRMSNRDRIAHLRAEADATAKEKAAAKAAKAAQPPSARKKSSSKAAPAPARGRVRIVWFVCDASGKEVQRFPYAQEAEARAAAEQLQASSGRTHFVKQADVPAE